MKLHFANKSFVVVIYPARIHGMSGEGEAVLYCIVVAIVVVIDITV